MHLTDDPSGSAAHAAVLAGPPASTRPPMRPAARRAVPPPTEASLSALVDAARDGSVAAFEQIYRRMAGQVAAYLRWNRASDPDGLANDVFMQVHRKIARFSGDEEGFRSWVFTIAHHRMIDDRRRAGRQVRVADGAVVEQHGAEGDVEDDAFAVLAHDGIRELLALLSPDQRDVVLLRVVADRSVEEVARLLGKREGAIKALQHRALAALRRHVERQVDGAIG